MEFLTEVGAGFVIGYAVAGLAYIIYTSLDESK